MESFTFKLRTKLLLIFFVLVLVPLLVFGWFLVNAVEDLVVRMVIRQIQNVAVDKMSLLEHWLDERKADLTVVSETSLVRSMDAETIAPYLHLMRREYGVYKDFTLVAASGEIVFTTCGDSIVPEGGCGGDSLALWDITYIDQEKESTFTLSVPVFSDDGLFLGTLFGRVGTNRIVYIILNVSLGRTGECYLVDREGRFLAHREPSRILSENITQTGSFRNIFEKKEGTRAYLDYRGIEVVGTSLGVRGTDWYIVVEQDLSEILEYSAKIKFIVFVTLCLGMVSAMMLTGIVSRHIVRPIRTLSRHAAAIGDEQAGLLPKDGAIQGVGRNDEIGMLARSFAHMYTRLKERQNVLEMKVERKEAELKETDIILQKTRSIAEQSEKFAALGRMGSAVAHEIRTPLTSLKLYLESVENRVEASREDVEDYHIAMGQIRRMEGTINRFLDYARPRDPVVATIHVAGLINEVLLMVKPLANRQDCMLDTALDETIPPVRGDRKQLAEALINLAVNAIEAVDGQGSVRVKVGVVENQDGRFVRIDVNDTGQGIDEDRIAHVFEPFFTTKASGTGLGLPLVLQTVEAHGGFMDVNSITGSGACFSVFLPCAPDHPDEDYGKDTDH
ncbi:hypothetical protein JCM14469_12710 [Desulfatiferula olefinivorans]